MAAPDAQLKKGDKALIGNSACRRYLRKAGARGVSSFEIDAGKLAEEARFDGIFVLRINAKVTPLQAVLRYAISFRSRTSSAGPRRSCAPGRSSIPPTPPSAATSSARSSRSRCRSGLVPEWKDLLRDLDRLAEVPIRHRGAEWLVRTDAAPHVAALFRAARFALPPRARKARPPPSAQSNPPQNAAAAPGVAPRRPEFHQNTNAIRCLSKSGVQVGSEPLLVQTRATMPMKPGARPRCDYEYERNGTANLLMLFAPLEEKLGAKGGVEAGSEAFAVQRAS